jgi:pilus assembly protein CpaB
MVLFNAQRLKFLSLALVMSAGTVVLTQQWLQGAMQRATSQARAKAPASTPQARILVARTALSPGAILRPGDVGWQPWPASDLNAAYLTPVQTGVDQMNGAVVRQALAAGQPVMRGAVIQPGDRSFMAAVLQPGYRAVTVNVTASAGVAGFVMPGDHVDLILSQSVGGSNGGGDQRFVSETVLKDLRVLGMDQRAAEAKKDILVPSTATLEVTPKGAEVIAVASELGKLSLALRSLANADQAPPDARQVTRTWDKDATQTPAAVHAVAHARPAGPRVQVIRGSQSESIAVAGGQP